MSFVKYDSVIDKEEETKNNLINIDIENKLTTIMNALETSNYNNNLLTTKLVAVEKLVKILVLEKQEQNKYIVQIRKELIEEKIKHKTTASIAVKAAAAAKKAAEAAATAAAAAAIK